MQTTIDMQSLALASVQSAQAIDRATLWPFVVVVEYIKADGKREQRTHIVQRAMHDAPDGIDLVPADAELLRVDAFPATRFDDMSAATRDKYRDQYKAFLLWRKAHALGKPVEALVPWQDYDAVHMDESVLRWAYGANRFCGD
ncbi:MAG: hypothetical protein HEQ39_09850 [Rhizobacter sp.]